MNRLEKTRSLILCALFAALTAVLSQIAIPIQPVPVNLATFSVFVAGGVLGAKRGAISQAAYVLLGVIGLPVFASFSGGMGILLGPTGGYIVGYVAAAWLVGALVRTVPWEGILVCPVHGWRGWRSAIYWAPPGIWWSRIPAWWNPCCCVSFLSFREMRPRLPWPPCWYPCCARRCPKAGMAVSV